jgi:hypothetical protein
MDTMREVDVRHELIGDFYRSASGLCSLAIRLRDSLLISYDFEICVQVCLAALVLYLVIQFWTKCTSPHGVDGSPS